MNPILRYLALLSVSILLASFAIAQPRSGGRPSEMNMKLMQPIMTAAMADRDALAKLKLTPKEQAAVRKLDEEMGKAIQKQFPSMRQSMSDADQKKMVAAVLSQMKARREKLKTVLGPARFAQYSKFYATAEKDPKLTSQFSGPEMEKRTAELKKRMEIRDRVEKEFAKKHLSESQIEEKSLTKAGASPSQKTQVKKIFAATNVKRSNLFKNNSRARERSPEQWSKEAKAMRDGMTKLDKDQDAQLTKVLGVEKLKVFKAERDRITTAQGKEKRARIEAEEKKAGIKPFGGPQGGMGRPNGGGRPGGSRPSGPR
jgi:hypothetical protein